MNDKPIVQHLELSILVPMRIVDRQGLAPNSMRQVAETLVGQGWHQPESPTSPVEKSIGHQAYSYFHPFVRRFLFDPDRVTVLERRGVCSVDVQLQAWQASPAIELRVAACRLWLFERTEIGVFQLSLSRMDPDGPPLSLALVQRVLDQIRRLYPPYFDETETHGRRQVVGGHCPVTVTLKAGDAVLAESDFADVDRYALERRQWQELNAAEQGAGRASFAWAAHWRHLLAPLGTRPDDVADWHAVQIGDDRAALMTFIAFSDPDAYRDDVSPGNWVRLCHADAPGQDRFPCQEHFLKGHSERPPFEDRFCYDRFHYGKSESDDKPSRIMNCGYAFTWAGCASDKGFFMQEKNGAIVTFRHIYTPMGVLAQFQRAALLASSFRISTLVPKQQQREISELETQRAYGSFVAFTQWYWFDEVSPQEQGQELFAMWRREMRLQELFDEVRQELRDIVEIQNARQQLALTRIAVPFALLTLALGFLALVSGALGMNVLEPEAGAALPVAAWIGEVAAYGLTVLGAVWLAAALLLFARHRSVISSTFSLKK